MATALQGVEGESPDSCVEWLWGMGPVGTQDIFGNSTFHRIQAKAARMTNRASQLLEREAEVHRFARGIERHLVAGDMLVEAHNQTPGRVGGARMFRKRIPEPSLQRRRLADNPAEKQAWVAEGPLPHATIQQRQWDGGFDGFEPRTSN